MKVRTKICKPKRRKETVGYRRVGTKRRDMRVVDDAGQMWDSNFERRVYEAARKHGLDVKRTERGRQGHTFPYIHVIRGSTCQSCGGTDVGKQHTYTPDLLVTIPPTSHPAIAGGYLIEAKGYMRSPERSLLRSFRKAFPALDLRFILQANYKCGKGTVGDWISKFLKCRWALFPKDGSYPVSWN